MYRSTTVPRLLGEGPWSFRGIRLGPRPVVGQCIRAVDDASRRLASAPGTTRRWSPGVGRHPFLRRAVGAVVLGGRAVHSPGPIQAVEGEEHETHILRSVRGRGAVSHSAPATISSAGSASGPPSPRPSMPWTVSSPLVTRPNRARSSRRLHKSPGQTRCDGEPAVGGTPSQMASELGFCDSGESFSPQNVLRTTGNRGY